MPEKTKVLALVIVSIIVGFGVYIGMMSITAPGTDGFSTNTSTSESTTSTTTQPTEPEVEINPDIFTFEGVDLMWIIVGGFKLKFNDTVVYIDPYNIDNIDDPVLETADYIVITHDHSPHFSLADIYSLSDDDTLTISSRIPAGFLHPDYTVYPGDNLTFSDVSFEFVPSYNVDKYRPGTTTLFHPPEYDYIGVIVDFNGTRIYHSGDTDRIPEMTSVSTDIALLPVSGYAWMEPDEAASAVEDIKQSSDLAYAIPIHWGYNQGTRWHAEQFVELANCTTVILEKLFERY
ncbi:MAG: MBL fold metallo-hydrolase [Candidatus Thorarchaeota archaeon]